MKPLDRTEWAALGLTFATFVVLALALASCSTPIQPGPGPTPTPVPAFDLRIVVGIEGNGTVQAFAGQVPLLTFVRVAGKGSMTIKTSAPFVTFDGDLIVTPMPGKEDDAQQAVATGAILIRRNGQPAGLTLPMQPPPPPSGPAPDSN